MSLNHIELNPHQLAALYSETLIEVTESQQVMPQANPRPKQLGGFAKRILVMVSTPSAPIIGDAELAFLTSVLSACRLTVGDIAILNNNLMETEASSEAIGTLDPARVLLFGIGPLQIGLPLDFPQFQLQQFNGRTYLHAPSLQELENDKEKKKQLWNSLKTLFGI
jgi:hypothetical protein